MISKIIRKKNDTNKRCKCIIGRLGRKDEKILPIYWRTIYKRRGEEGSKSIWNCFIPLPKLTATLTSSCKSFQVILEKWSSQHRDPSHPFPSLDKGHAAFRVGKRSTVCVYVCMLRVGGEKGVQTGTK